MGSSGPYRFDIAEIYATYCDIVSKNDYRSSRESLTMLSKSLESRVQPRDTIFNELFKLMALLKLPVDSHHFSCFYDFVFFICRENGQKNISVCKAITAWRLVLTGRFRLLNEWCKFVEKRQRHNITEDTWQQLLAFSRCVNDDFECYDPKGAWPLLIDDFVEHMYSAQDLCCKCDDLEAQPGISNSCSGGYNLLPSSKRKFHVATDGYNGEAPSSSGNSACHPMGSKRLRPSCVAERLGCRDSDVGMSGVDEHKQGSVGCLHTSVCAVEDNLSKGFEGHLSLGCCFQFDQKTRVA